MSLEMLSSVIRILRFLILEYIVLERFKLALLRILRVIEVSVKV